MSGTFQQNTSPSATQSYILLVGHEKRMKVSFQDINNVPYDPSEIILTVYNPDNSVNFTETYSGSSVKILKDSVGYYYCDFVSDASINGDYQFLWAWRDTLGGEQFSGFQTASAINLQAFSAFPYLRNQIDKAQLDLNSKFGYSDWQLYSYIKGGLSEINRVPPNTDFTIVTFPWKLHQQLLIDIATYVGIGSQSLLAISTDANYSLQGNSMTVDHFSKLSSFMGMLRTRMDTSLLHFKLNYMGRIGAVRTERGAGFRQQSLFSSSPSGISFSNILGVR